MNKRDNLNFLSENWNIFPTGCIYKTSPTFSFIPKEKQSIYVFSFFKISKPVIKKLNTKSLCFDIYQLSKEDYSEPVGFCFIPSAPKNYLIRPTPIALAAVSPACTKKDIEESERKIIWENKAIQILWLSCGTEIVTNLASTMKIYLEKG